MRGGAERKEEVSGVIERALRWEEFIGREGGLAIGGERWENVVERS